MRSRLPLLVLVVATACASNQPAPVPAPAEPTAAPQQPAAEDVATRYARVMDRLGELLEADVEAWANTEFATQAEALAALIQLTPAGPRTPEHLRVALADAGMSPDELVAFTEDHPEMVAEHGKRIEKRLQDAMVRHNHQVAAIDKLPPGNLDATQRRMLEMIRDSDRVVPIRPAATSLPDWTAFASVDDLHREVAAAAAARQPVIIHIRANWCTPCMELEQTTFAAAEVKTRLASYRRLYIDVSNASDDDDAVQHALDAENLPAVLIYTDATALAAHLAGSGPRPRPTTYLTRLVDAPTLLASLPNP